MSNTKFAVSGKEVSLYDDRDVSTHDSLPVGVYTIKERPMNGPLYLERVEAFPYPEKIYGDAPKMASRIITTFMSREKSTGVLLQGVKGSGKTLLTKIVSNQLLERGISTIIVSQSFSGMKFNEFIGNLSSSLILFDEFEKVFGNGSKKSEDDESIASQESLLTLFDGTISTKHLYLLSINNQYKVDEHFFNRPGRIFYNLKYKGLDENFIREYLDEKLQDKTKIDSFLRASSAIREFTFDMLQALVEELNRYGESVKDAMRYLNIDFKTSYQKMTIKAYCDGELIPNVISPGTVYNEPATTNRPTEITVFEKKGTIFSKEGHDFMLNSESFNGLKTSGSSYKFDYKGKQILFVLEYEREFEYDFDAF